MKRYLIAGMSHVESLRRGATEGELESSTYIVEFINLRRYRRVALEAAEPLPVKTSVGSLYVDAEEISGDFSRLADGVDATVFCINGNEHNIIGLIEKGTLHDAVRIVRNGVGRALAHWIGLLRPQVQGKVFLLIPPPPIQSEKHIRMKPGEFKDKLNSARIRNSDDRLTIWKNQCEVTREFGRANEIRVLEPPATVFSPAGFLAVDCRGADPTHGNHNYGCRVMRHVCDELQASFHSTLPGMIQRKHPYQDLPDHAYWKNSVGEVSAGSIDPVVRPRFLIKPSDKVATAGSCFAQHISKRLRSGGFNFLVAEHADDCETSADAQGFYDFSARYGNVYTARQLTQLFDRAFGYFQPIERTWPRPEGGFCDPFRPRIEPLGFASKEEVLQNTEEHLAAVRRMFSQLDVFVFTLGLTECWASRFDGAVYPIAPGVAGGTYHPEKHAFINFSAAEVKADMQSFLLKLSVVNPNAKVVLTVSPVPLAATGADRHVIVSTAYSKAVLRVAADEIVAVSPQVEYFPSYEIITGPQARGSYFAADRRSVTEAGVDHVMRVFMRRMTSGRDTEGHDLSTPDIDESADYADMEAAAEVACDEELYSR